MLGNGKKWLGDLGFQRFTSPPSCLLTNEWIGRSEKQPRKSYPFLDQDRSRQVSPRFRNEELAVSYQTLSQKDIARIIDLTGILVELESLSGTCVGIDGS